MKYHLIIALIIFHIILVKDAVSSSPTRLIAVNEAPASYVDEDGNVQGYVVDIVRNLARRLAIESEIEVMPEARALKTAYYNNNVIVFAFSRNAERDRKLNWIGPVLTKTWGIYGLNTSPQKKHESLENYPSIGVVNGDIRHEWLASQGLNNLHLSVSHEQNIKLLLRKRISSIAYDRISLHLLSTALGIDPTNFRLLKQLKQENVYIGMSKNLPNIEKWQKAFIEFREEGELHKTTEKWIDRMKVQYNIEAHANNEILSLD